MERWLRGLLVLLLAGVLLAGSAAAAPSRELIDAAKREGRVVWYTATALLTAENLAAMFEREYGIRVEVVRSGSERIFTRFLEEAAVGAHYADVIETADAGQFVYLADQDLLASYTPEGAAWTPKEYQDPQGRWLAWYFAPLVAVYNPEIVPAAEAPRGWQDFLDPRWRGQITVGHPEYSGSIVTAVYALAEQFGWSYFEALRHQDLLLGRSVHDAPQAVAAGERPLGLVAMEYFVLNLKAAGNPVEPIYPDEGLPLVAEVTAIARHAPNPAAARLFTEFLLSEPVQSVLVHQENLHVFHPGVRYPEGRRRLDEFTLFQADPRRLMESTQHVKEQFVRIFEDR